MHDIIIIAKKSDVFVCSKCEEEKEKYPGAKVFEVESGHDISFLPLPEQILAEILAAIAWEDYSLDDFPMPIIYERKVTIG